MKRRATQSPPQRAARADKFKGDWRYIAYSQSRLDSMISHNPEDDLIAAIDRGEREGDEGTISLVQWLYDNIDDVRISNIIFRYQWVGDSMEEIGADMGLTRVRIWQLYQTGLKTIREQMSAQEYKRLFLGD